MKNISIKSNSANRNQMLAIYEEAPYPEALGTKTEQSIPLLTHWINAVVAPKGLALGPNCNLLVAGCGTGAEVFMLAELFPQATVVGIDFSERSIARAKELAQQSHLKNLRFEVADLMDANCLKNEDSYDFILCHGVADYVLDPATLMQTLSNCLSAHGVICMTVNSPYHPAGRIREAFAQLGIAADEFVDSPPQRALLQLLDQLMGVDAKILGLGNAPKAYLKVDIFPPIAHHLSMEQWSELALRADLNFAGSIDALMGLLSISDIQLPLLYPLGKAALSVWMANLYQRPGMQLLFTKQKLNEPQFHQLDKFWDWKPRLDACLGKLPILEGDPNRIRSITLQFKGLPDLVINSTAYDLEFLRRCDGQLSLGQIREAIAEEVNLDSLLASLFRAYHYGLLAG